MADFMILIKGGDPQSRQLSAEEMQNHMQKWGVWMKGLTEKGQLKGGQPLEKTGKLVKANGVITDGPFPEAKDLVGGYLIIDAKDAAEAAKIVRDCPIFEDGQNLDAKSQPSLEVRAIAKMEM